MWCFCQNSGGQKIYWNGLPKDKSLFYAKQDCGLPIGNLSSQFFSNIYMNVFDQYVKRELKCCHYGRYVDDAYIVSDDRECLKKLIPEISQFLSRKLGLEINHQSIHFLEFSHIIKVIA